MIPHHQAALLFASKLETISVLGTVHHHRQRWNPFDPNNLLQPSSHGQHWLRWFTVNPQGGRHGDGIYTIRFVLNHNPRRQLKLVGWQVDPQNAHDPEGGKHLLASLAEEQLGLSGENLSFRVHKLCSLCVQVDPDRGEATLSTNQPQSLSPVSAATSLELNGFVWDNLDPFAKFDERHHGRSWQRINPDHWEIKVPLRLDGGIDFRHDGIYQFLISRNGDEDQGFSAINSDQASGSLQLVSGSGFGSSHGTCRHSAPTLKVEEEGEHRFSLFRHHDGYRLTVVGPSGGKIRFCNQQASTIQLLGTIFTENSFDPTHPQASMEVDESGSLFYKEVELLPGSYVINFAIGKELFLDTMGLGCWLENDGPSLRGVAWHGKPNELNIGFKVIKAGLYGFHYDRSTDIFEIEPISAVTSLGRPLQAVNKIETLSLVGNFPPPLAGWSPDADANLMADLGDQRFEKLVALDDGSEYQFKFVANRSNWLIVFADYEFDGFGMSYQTPTNPFPFDSDLASLKSYGHLTSHGNPPAISYKASRAGWHRFAVDLNTGAYAVTHLQD